MSIRSDFTIDQGADFATVINLDDENDVSVDLTGYSAIAQLRRHPTSITKYDFIVTVLPSGTVTLGMNKDYTNTIPAGRYVYDCILTDSLNRSTKILYGIIEIKPGVSR